MRASYALIIFVYRSIYLEVSMFTFIDVCNVALWVRHQAFPTVEEILHWVWPPESFADRARPRRPTCSSSSSGRRPRWRSTGSSPRGSWRRPGRKKSSKRDRWIQQIRQRTVKKNNDCFHVFQVIFVWKCFEMQDSFKYVVMALSNVDSDLIFK